MEELGGGVQKEGGPWNNVERFEKVGELEADEEAIRGGAHTAGEYGVEVGAEEKAIICHRPPTSGGFCGCGLVGATE